MRDEREVEVLQFYEQGADTSRAQSVVIEVRERNAPTRRSSREIDESKSDVIHTVGVPQIQCIHRAVDTGCAWKMVFSVLTRGLCVFLKPVTSQASKMSWIHPWIGNRWF